MICTCAGCGREFLTEADPHVVRPTRNGYLMYCYCQIQGFAQGELDAHFLVMTSKELKALMDIVSMGYWNHHLEARAKAQSVIDRLEAMKKGNSI